ncbi:FAD/NAD(P)-binding oxidoreductase [Clavibacter michiganensis subsp. michiganensis]|uniref:NAD(P)/FAD-dependent oxidoreductase n=3 Tax=Clavibacter michiganensis TaxID=28447 RepID=UPI001D0AD1EA|nr:FAD/NAD(P)-binding oxidoreductase [Clavibacter michiganensis]UDM11464.1 NAD(P)/FAD-dependent oxidoreductase [Clavibacter michiganensis subsp. michiganensis]WDD26162.1 FAD/NAD(P)-binding oxidoreductase [Clavibacter michiganensis subsp. michiganensis]WDD29277.1 FAD/NAD(P)-binding oxidoreductase [Clavibacter michiganensis subsp. michiganensis]
MSGADDRRHVVVIGAGPAGLAAAVAARGRGARVTLLDASDELGGQYWRHLPATRPAARERILHHGWDAFTALRGRLAADDGCEIVTGAQVWAIERPAPDAPAVADSSAPPAAVVHVLVGQVDGSRREPLALRPDALVLATGAHDRTLPFPGWDLPGVFTAGAAQALAKGERVAIGDRVIVAGAGPFLLPVAVSLVQAGARVVGIHEAARVPGLARGWLRSPLGLARAPHKAAELAGYVSVLARERIGYSTGSAVVAAHGTDRVEAVTVQRLDASWAPIPGTERRIAVDAVCVGHGFTPRLELPIAAGCRIGADRFVEVDASQGAGPSGVFAAGEITGIGGVDQALAEGEVAGHCAAGGSPSDAAVAPAVRRRAVAHDVAGRIEAAHGIRPGWTGWLRDDTLACRCEEVPVSRIRATARAASSTDLRSMKLATRAGLGICQGRVCGRTVEQLLAAEAPACGSAPAASPAAAPGPGSDRRPIASPVRLGELAAAYERRDTGPPSLAAAAPGVDDPPPAGVADPPPAGVADPPPADDPPAGSDPPRDPAPPTTPAPPRTTDRKDTP